jgi:hypothetical protein
LTGNIPTDETPVNVPIMYPGQDAVLDLNVSEINQPTFLNITSSAISSFFVFIKSPTGTIIRAEYSDTPNKIIQLNNLPFAGAYKVEFNPEYDAYGTATISYSLNPLSSIVIDGPALSFTIFGNQTGQVIFTGNAGQRVFIKLDTGPFQSVNVQIVKPNGEILDEGATNSFRNNAIDISTLPESGTYRIVIDPSSSFGGGISISASSTARVGGNCNLDANVCVSKEVFTAPGQSVDLDLDIIEFGGEPPTSFANTKSSKANTTNSLVPIDVEFIMSEVNVAGEVMIFDDANNLVNSFNIDATTEVVTFSGPGIYRMRIVPAPGESGSFKFRLNNLSIPPPNS